MTEFFAPAINYSHYAYQLIYTTPLIITLSINTSFRMINMQIKQRNNNNIVALDIGASKIACLVGNVVDKNTIKILGMGYVKSQGITSGSISNMKAAEKSVKAAIDAAERISGHKIKNVFLGVSSNILISHTTECSAKISSREIVSKDITKMILTKTDHYTNHNINILHTFLYDYSLDGNKNISSPLGLCGETLRCKMHVVSTNTNNMINFENCLASCNVSIAGYVSSAYASGLSCITADEMKLGVNFIEFGAGTTSISIFHNSNMIYTDGIPIGISHVTKDISIGLGISTQSAERIQNLYGAVIMNENDRDEMIEIIEENFDTMHVPRSTIISIMQARIEEIIEMLLKNLSSNNVGLASRTVISGGGARMVGLKELIAHHIDTNIRRAEAKCALNIDKNLNFELTSAAGILHHAQDIIASEAYRTSYHSTKRNLIARILRWLQKYLLK